MAEEFSRSTEAAVNAHFRRNGVTDKESQDDKVKKSRRQSKVDLSRR